MQIAVVPGDGIGPEVVREGVRVLERAVSRYGLSLSFQYVEAGAGTYRSRGISITDEAFLVTQKADAIFLGAIGLPNVRYPDGTEVNGPLMQRWRRELDLYANLRPIKSFAGVPTIYGQAREVDMAIVRENSEGLYASNGGGAVVFDRIVTDTLIVTRAGSERISRFAFDWARRSPLREGHRPKVTCVDKANILRGYAFFRQIFEEVAQDYPDVGAETLYADAASLLMTLNPEQYQVVVAENLLGDLFSDLAAAYVGGLGLAPSGEMGSAHGMFQPSHGSAPMLAGQDVANPVASILSAAMMLDWLGDRASDVRWNEAAQAIFKAVDMVLAQPRWRTADLGGQAKTHELGEAIADAVASAG